MRCRFRSPLFALVLSLSSAGASFALAADPPTEPPTSREESRAGSRDVDETTARNLVRHGLAAHARGEHAAALADYERASALVPDANLPWLYRAEALRALGRSDEAVAAYGRYLVMDPSVSDADAVRTKLTELRRERRGKLVVETNPDGAKIRDLDLGTTLGTSPVTLLLTKGKHRLEIARSGYFTQQIEVEIQGGDVQRQTLALVGTTPTRRGQPACQGRLAGGIIAGGVGVAGLVIGIVLDAAVAGGAKRDFEAARAAEDNETAASAHDRFSRASLGAGLSYVLGGVLAAGGGAVASWPCRNSRPSSSAAQPGWRF